MKLRVGDLPSGSCFRSSRGKTVKKLEDGRCAVVGKGGKIRRGPCPRGKIDTAPCPVSLLGAALSGRQVIVEVGSALPHEKRRGR